MVEAPKPSPAIDLSRLRAGGIASWFGGPMPWGTFMLALVAMEALDRICPQAASEGGQALRFLCITIPVALVFAAVLRIASRRYLRDVERSVLDFVGGNGPVRRSALLKACRDSRYHPAILLAVEQLVADGRLDPTSTGYRLAESSAPHEEATRAPRSPA